MPATLRNPVGHWVRFGTTLKPAIAGDNIETTGDVSASDMLAGNYWFDSIGGNTRIRHGGPGGGTFFFENSDSKAALGLINDQISIVAFNLPAGARANNDDSVEVMRKAELNYELFTTATATQHPKFVIWGFPDYGLTLDSASHQIVAYDSDTAYQISTSAPVIIVPKDVILTGGNRYFESSKFKISSIGGYCILLTNRTGANSVAGHIVKASTGTDDAFTLAGVNELMPIGIVLDSGISDGSEAWVVVSGIAGVLVDAGGCARGDRLITGAIGGFATVNNAPLVAVHFQEIGHSIQTRAGAGLARCVVHFN